MKKASKVLTLILVVVLTVGIFASCSMFGKNSVKYRNSTAVKVGGEEISVGKVLDTFNSNYNTYSSYISAGYLTVESLLNMTMTSLYSQFEKVDAYKNISGVQTTPALKDICRNAEYLTADEMAFVIRYVKYMVYSTVDSLVEGYADEIYELKDKEEPDTSRDFTETDDLLGADTYAEYVYRQNFHNEDMDEYIDKYYPNLIKTDDLKVDAYVYADAAAGANMLADLNERVEGETKITFEELQGWQTKALAQYRKSVESSYRFDLEQLIKNQIEDVVTSVIVAKYNLRVNGAIENGDIANTLNVLKTNHQQLVDSDTAKFATDGDFITFIEGLSSGDFIYNVPEGYTYIFVKNILIPFSDNQKAILATAAKQLGTTDSDEYRALRQQLATQIVADDFTSGKDSDGKYKTQVKDIFTEVDGKLVINSACKPLADYLQNGSVTAMSGKSKDETIIELMKQFNTDTAQHTAAYDYVVRVGATPASYTAKWVSEFVDGANEAWNAGKDNGAKNYALAVSEYGVHIIYYVDDVAAQTFDFDDKSKLTDPTSNEYKLFKSYFETQSSLMLSDDSEKLHDQYVADNKITKTSNFDRFLKDNNFTFDFEASLKDEDEE